MQSAETQGAGVFLLALRSNGVRSHESTRSLDELAELALSAGCRVLGQQVQKRERMHPGSVFGPGKLLDIQRSMQEIQATVAIFDGLLSPSQGLKLERALGCLVLDRAQLILEIFRRNARTGEARKQVELAELEYMLPRLVGLWAHLDRERGGIAGSKGIGEKQIDVDRTLIRQRITRLRRELQRIQRERDVQKKRRNDHCLRATLIGYTNAGKSTLMNRLTGARQVAADRLFATLDSTVRVLRAHPAPACLLTDTVGFIARLPPQLVASFRSTLEIARDADLLLHVVDASRPDYEECIAITEQTLEDIGAADVPRLLVFNKTDCLPQGGLEPLLLRKKYPQAVFTSALSEDGSLLRARIMECFAQGLLEAEVRLDAQNTRALRQLHRMVEVRASHWEDGFIQLRVLGLPSHLRRLQAQLGDQAHWQLADALPLTEPPAATLPATGG